MDTKVTVGIIDSRGDLHPEWVQTAVNSVKKSCEIYPVKLMVINNREKSHSIGYCLNKIARESDTDYIFFLDDDDWISPDIIATALFYALKQPMAVAVNTRMTAFSEEDGQLKHNLVPREHKGLIKRDYVLKYPFDETLEKGVDREWFDRLKMRGDLVIHLPYHYGYYYRQHDEHRARATGNIRFMTEAADIHFQARQSNFIEPVYKQLKQLGYSVAMDDRKFSSNNVKTAKVIWCEWLNQDAFDIANLESDAFKILRIHAYEVFTERLFYIDLDKFDLIIFVAEHIRDIAEKRLGRKLKNAVVIHNGVDMGKYTLKPNKLHNNKIVFAGSVERKKGIGELVMIAGQYKDYEFHVAGTYYEEDVAEYLRDRKPENLHFHGQVHNMPEFYKDYSYVINTSLREGCPMAVLEAMASGCKPIVRNWIGAETLFPEIWLWNEFSDIDRILGGPWEPERYRNYVNQLFNFDTKFAQINEIIDNGLNKSTVTDTVQNISAG